jgi:hypothetical protein
MGFGLSPLPEGEGPETAATSLCKPRRDDPGQVEQGVAQAHERKSHSSAHHAPPPGPFLALKPQTPHQQPQNPNEPQEHGRQHERGAAAEMGHGYPHDQTAANSVKWFADELARLANFRACCRA